MRIIAGEYKNRTIWLPKSKPDGMMTDMTREALFNILGGEIAGARFADLFAGSGGVGLEAVSRGAMRVTFVERKRLFARCVIDNLRRFNIDGDQARVWENDVFQLPTPSSEWAQWDIAFLDPPRQVKDNFLDTLVRREILQPGMLIVVNRPLDRSTTLRSDLLTLIDQRVYGKAALFFYS